jgi:beta-lactamase class A
MKRRDFLVAAGVWVAGCRLAAAGEEFAFANLENKVGGRVGVLAIDTGDEKQIWYRADERFAMCSTFKWLLAACVLEGVDRGEIDLEERLEYTEEDLLEYAPVARAHLARGALPVEALCAAAVSISDNTAANLLLERIGGPAALTAFLRRCGDEVTRLDRYEPELNTNIPGDPRDTTTPRAMAETMRTILLGNVLVDESRARLQQWLKETKTGLTRLRAGLPPDWVAGDKTGTGVNGAANDVAIAWPPGRPPILIAAYLSDSSARPDVLNVAHEAIAATVTRNVI